VEREHATPDPTGSEPSEIYMARGSTGDELVVVLA
jgi:hypothetical protein